MDIFDLLSGKLDSNAMEELCKSTGADRSKMEQAIKIGMPTLIEGMSKNASSLEGASALAKVLDKHKDNGVEDVAGFLKNVDTKDGSKILEHIFGNNNKKIQNNISAQTGLKDNQVSGMLAQLAPLLLGMLGKQKSSRNVGSNDLFSMLMGLMGRSGNKGIMKTVTNMIDADGDGNIIDDISKMAGGLFKK